MLTIANRAILQTALTRYDLVPPVRITLLPTHNHRHFRVQTGAGTLRGKLFARDYLLAALAYEVDLLVHLAQLPCSFAVPLPLADRDGTRIQATDLGWLVLVPEFPGAQLDPSDSAQVLALGRALGELHQALAHMPVVAQPGRALFQLFTAFPPPERDPCQLTTTQLGVAPTAAAEELLAWWRAEATALAAFVAGPYRQLPQQIVHHDPAPYNVLTQHGQVTAFLDFEFACPGPPALDLVMALRMTMRTWEVYDPWPIAEHLLTGYGAVARLDPAAVAVFPDLLRLRSAMGTFWALGRAGPLDGVRMLQQLGYVRAQAAWLAQHGAQLTALVDRLTLSAAR
jgi:homoserine kinase type II